MPDTFYRMETLTSGKADKRGQQIFKCWTYNKTVCLWLPNTLNDNTGRGHRRSIILDGENKIKRKLSKD